VTAERYQAGAPVAAGRHRAKQAERPNREPETSAWHRSKIGRDLGSGATGTWPDQCVNFAPPWSITRYRWRTAVAITGGRALGCAGTLVAGPIRRGGTRVGVQWNPAVTEFEPIRGSAPGRAGDVAPVGGKRGAVLERKHSVSAGIDSKCLALRSARWSEWVTTQVEHRSRGCFRPLQGALAGERVEP
jgi:hypothetical protein